ncbi:MAG: hypothetical protein ACE5HV_18240, partial [Acidobacteriota bacterium]
DEHGGPSTDVRNHYRQCEPSACKKIRRPGPEPTDGHCAPNDLHEKPQGRLLGVTTLATFDFDVFSVFA